MSPHDTWRSSVLTNILAWVCSIGLWGACLCYTMPKCTLRAVHVGFHVPSPTHVSKSQHGGKSLNFWASWNHSNMVYFHWSWILIILCKLSSGDLLVLRVGSSFLLNPTLNTSPKPHPRKVLPCKHPCHTSDLGLGTPCEVVRPNFHVINGWGYTD